MPTIPMLTLIITKYFVMEYFAHRTRNWILLSQTHRQDGKCNGRNPRDANPSRKNKKIRCKASDIAGHQNIRVQISEVNPKSGVQRLKPDFLDSTIRGITQKKPSKKCRCAIDIKTQRSFNGLKICFLWKP